MTAVLQVLQAVTTDGRGDDEDWKVLIVDKPALRMISTSSRMSEIMECGVTVVEDVTKRRKPLPMFHGVYLLLPTRDVSAEP